MERWRESTKRDNGGGSGKGQHNHARLKNGKGRGLVVRMCDKGQKLVFLKGKVMMGERGVGIMGERAVWSGDVCVQAHGLLRAPSVKAW